MPLALEPGQTFRVVLESDKAKPEGEQPYFLFCHLSGRKWKEMARLADSTSEAETGEEALDRIYQALAVGLVGWGNMKNPDTGDDIAFDKAELDRLLTLGEAAELMAKFRNQGFGPAELKNSESPSESDSAASAKTAADPENVETSPQAVRQ